ncbi:hypothetical protein NC652_033518 [Populus alba x Populus x berolinensis]|nr:hypothetical protein NC652_033518 [Populus alba x Populus x berolinensis]
MLLQSQAKLVDGTLSGSKRKIHGIARSDSMLPLGFRVDGRLPIFIRPYSNSGVARMMEIPNTRKMKRVHQCTDYYTKSENEGSTNHFKPQTLHDLEICRRDNEREHKR